MVGAEGFEPPTLCLQKQILEGAQFNASRCYANTTGAKDEKSKRLLFYSLLLEPEQASGKLQTTWKIENSATEGWSKCPIKKSPIIKRTNPWCTPPARFSPMARSWS